MTKLTIDSRLSLAETVRGSTMSPTPITNSAGAQVPFLRLFQCHKPILHKLDYCEVVSSLIEILMLLFNKTDTMILSEEMLEKYM